MPLAVAGGMVGVYMGPPLLAPSSLSLSGDLGTKITSQRAPVAAWAAPVPPQSQPYTMVRCKPLQHAYYARRTTPSYLTWQQPQPAQLTASIAARPADDTAIRQQPQAALRLPPPSGHPRPAPP